MTISSPSSPPPPLDDPNVSNPLECPPLRWGLIGCGRISHDFTQALKLLPTAQVVACSARSLDSAKSFAEKHGIPKACELCFFSLLCVNFIIFIFESFQMYLLIYFWNIALTMI